jgi:pterin-4a-carbinolamine dehydratase
VQIIKVANHHPDREIRYNKVVLSLVGHDVGEVMNRNTRLARLN